MRMIETLQKHEGPWMTLAVIAIYAAIFLITYLAW
jgi:hypothetical protein